MNEQINKLTAQLAQLTEVNSQLLKNAATAEDAISKAKQSNDALQKRFTVGTPFWHLCEETDDWLHNAAAAVEVK